MIAYLLLGVCLLAAFLLARNWLLTVDPKLLARVLRYLGVGIFSVIGLLLLFIGRYGLALPLLLLAASILRGWRLPVPRFPSGGFGAKPSSGQASKVETEYLSMTLEHDSGVMAGRVLKGTFTGKNLAQLAVEQLVALLSECYRNDPESAQLLETYMDRTQPGWREAADAAEAQGAQAGRGWGRRPQADKTKMSVAEAREILGVADDASADDIKEAYRRLMQKLHPDQGGSTYLAAKINQAKDVLLGV
jgi:DnaJ domain